MGIKEGRSVACVFPVTRTKDEVEPLAFVPKMRNGRPNIFTADQEEVVAVDVPPLLHMGQGDDAVNHAHSIGNKALDLTPTRGIVVLGFERRSYCPPVKSVERARRDVKQTKSQPTFTKADVAQWLGDATMDTICGAMDDLVHERAREIRMGGPPDGKRSKGYGGDAMLITRLTSELVRLVVRTSPAAGLFIGVVMRHILAKARSTGIASQVYISVEQRDAVAWGLADEGQTVPLEHAYCVGTGTFGPIWGEILVPRFGEAELMASMLAARVAAARPTARCTVVSNDYDVHAMMLMLHRVLADDAYDRLRWLCYGTVTNKNIFVLNYSDLAAWAARRGGRSWTSTCALLLSFLDNDYTRRSTWSAPLDANSAVVKMPGATVFRRFLLGHSPTVSPIDLDAPADGDEASFAVRINEDGYRQMCKSLMNNSRKTTRMPSHDDPRMQEHLRLLLYWSGRREFDGAMGVLGGTPPSPPQSPVAAAAAGGEEPPTMTKEEATSFLIQQMLEEGL